MDKQNGGANKGRKNEPYWGSVKGEGGRERGGMKETLCRGNPCRGKGGRGKALIDVSVRCAGEGEDALCGEEAAVCHRVLECVWQ